MSSPVLLSAAHPPSICMQRVAACFDSSVKTTLEEQEGHVVESPTERKPRRSWTWPERWQVSLAAAGLLVAVVATVGQFVH